MIDIDDLIDKVLEGKDPKDVLTPWGDKIIDPYNKEYIHRKVLDFYYHISPTMNKADILTSGLKVDSKNNTVHKLKGIYLTDDYESMLYAMPEFSIKNKYSLFKIDVSKFKDKLIQDPEMDITSKSPDLPNFNFKICIIDISVDNIEYLGDLKINKLQVRNHIEYKFSL